MITDEKSIFSNADLDRMTQALQTLTELLGRREAFAPTPVDKAAPAPDPRALPRRLEQTLELLLTGDSEKQVARKLQLSKHTVHVYVKTLYRRFEVNSRSELMAKLLRSR